MKKTYRSKQGIRDWSYLERDAKVTALVEPKAITLTSETNATLTTTIISIPRLEYRFEDRLKPFDADSEPHFIATGKCSFYGDERPS